MSVALVFNPLSGSFVDRTGDESAEDHLQRASKVAGADDVHLQAFDGERLGDLRDAWSQDRPDAVWVAGGDGTVLALAVITRELDIPLGIVPTGTMNLLARDLGMDLDVANAMAQLRHAPAVRIDVAELNGESFLCISNFGMPTRLTERRERLRRRPQWVRWPLLLWYMLKLLVVYPRMRITLRIDGRQYPMRTRAASVSNNQLIPGGALMPARERLDRGELGVYVARETSFWSLPRLALGLLTREWQDDDELVSFSGDRLSIDVRGKKTMAIMCDGEMRQVSLPLQYAVRPRALQVLKPRKDSS